MQQQQLHEEVRWLQQMLAKEQQSKQAVLGQLQDERAKCALLELEILHAAQAAQEMGESLCLFFNPVFNQQSEQLLLQQVQGQASSEHTWAHQQHEEEPALLSAGVFAGYDFNQQQEPEVMLTAPELGKEASAHAPAAAEASQQDAVAGCDPDTAAHDQQTPPRLRESAALIASTEQCPSEGRLHSPRRSLKALSSPGRKSSHWRLARSSPCRSLRLSNSSSPMKPLAVAGAAAFAACERTSGTDQQQQQQLQARGPHKAQSPGVREAQGPAAAASSTDDLDATQQVGAQPRSAPQQVPLDAGAAAASVGVSDSNKPANSKPAFRAAAAAAAAVQQSLSAARAAIAAAEAVRGQSRISTARSHRGGSSGSNEAARRAGTPALSGAAAEKSAPLVAAGAMEAAPVVSSLHVDTTAADLGKEGSGLDCKSSSSDGSAWSGPSHKLPASIVSEPQEPAGGPTAAAAAANNQSASLTDNSTLQQGSQAGSSAAAVAICPLWQPEQLGSQPVSQLVSNLSRKGQSSSSSSSGDQGSPAAATLGPGTAAAHQHTDGSSSSNASSMAALPHSEPGRPVQNAAAHASESDIAALPVQPAGADPSTAEPADTEGAPAAADVQGTAKEAVGSAAENAAIPAVPAAQSASCSLCAGAPAFAAAGRGCGPPSACAAVRRSSAARPPLPPVHAASAAQHAALKLAYGPRHRQACSSKSHSTAGAQPAVEGRPSLPQLPHPRLQEQEQQQGPPPKAADIGAVGPMHAAAFGPQQHAQLSTSSTQGASSGHAQGSSMPEYKASVYKTGHQAAAAAAAGGDDDIYAHLPPVPEVYNASTLRTRQQQPGQRQLMPRRLYSDDTGNDTSSDRQRLLPPNNSSLHGPLAWSAAAARASAARPAHAAAELEMCHAAVCAPAEAAPASCLSPLYWHQSNLGSSRAGFYQAMVSS